MVQIGSRVKLFKDLCTCKWCHVGTWLVIGSSNNGSEIFCDERYDVCTLPKKDIVLIR